MIHEGMELIRDESIFSKECYESTAPSRKGVLRTIKGPVAEWGNLNRNNRMYTEKLWDRVIESDYVKEQKECKSLFGEANHPEARFEVDFSRVSHSITDLYKVPEKNQVYATIDILDTPLGNILDVLYEYGSVIGYSSRAGGVLHKRKTHIDVDEESYHFVTFDAVPFPSVKSARPLNEGTEVIKNIEISEEAHNKLLQIISESSKKDREVLKDFIYSVQEGYNLDRELSVLEGLDVEKEKKEDVTESLKGTTLCLLKESYKQINSLKFDKTQAETQLMKTNETVEDLKSKLEALLNKSTTLTESNKSFSDTLEKLNEEKNTFEEQVKTLSEKNRELNNTIKEYKDSEDDRELQVLEMKVLKNDLVKTQYILKDKDTEIRELQQQLQSKIDESTSIKQEVENLQKFSDYDKVAIELGNTFKELTALKESYAMNIEDLNSYKAKVRKLEDRCSKVNEGIDTVVKENDELIHELKTYKGRYQDSSEKISLLNESIGSLNKKIILVESTLQRCREDLLKSVCSHYGANPNNILEKLDENYTAEDIHIACESVSSKENVLEVIGIDTNDTEPEYSKTNKERLSGMFTNNRRGKLIQ